jgi:hypothetical protein
MTPAVQDRVVLDLSKQPTDNPAEVSKYVAAAKALEICDDDSLAIAEQLIQRSAVRVGAIEKEWDEVRDAAVKTHKAIMGKIKTWCEPWVTIRTTLEPRRATYLRKKEQERREAEQRIAREAEAERRRVEAEAAVEREKANAAARELERQGDMRKAEEARIAAEALEQQRIAEARMLADNPVVVAASAVKTAGVGNARPWVAVFTDPLETIRAIADGRLKVTVEPYTDGTAVAILLEGKELVTINKSAASYQAKRLRREDIGVPGFKGEEAFTMRVSRQVQPSVGFERDDEVEF